MRHGGSPKGQKKLEVGSPELTFNRMEVVNEAREEPEEWLLLEVDTLLFMHIGDDEDKDRQNLRQVMDLGMVVVNATRIPVVLDDECDQAGQSIQRLETRAAVGILQVCVDTRLRADSEKERRHFFRLEDSLFRHLGDERNEVLLWRSGALENEDPLVEAPYEFLSHLSVLFDVGHPDRRVH